jgi:hypothetical protein
MAAKVIFVDESSRRNRRKVAEFEKAFKVLGFNEGIEVSLRAITLLLKRECSPETKDTLERLEGALTKQAKVIRQ